MVSNGVIVSAGNMQSWRVIVTDRHTVGEGKRFRHAGFSAGEVGKIHTAELYCGRGSLKQKSS